MDLNKLDKICVGCFKSLSDGKCPYCGFDGNETTPPHLLAPRTILAGRYLTGRALFENELSVTYLAYNIAEDSPLFLEEYAPVGVTQRSEAYGMSASSAADEPAFRSGKEAFFAAAQQSLAASAEDGRVTDCFLENGTAYAVQKAFDGTPLTAREPLHALLLSALSGTQGAGKGTTAMNPFADTASAAPQGEHHAHPFPSGTHGADTGAGMVASATPSLPGTAIPTVKKQERAPKENAQKTRSRGMAAALIGAGVLLLAAAALFVFLGPGSGLFAAAPTPTPLPSESAALPDGSLSPDASPDASPTPDGSASPDASQEIPPSPDASATPDVSAPPDASPPAALPVLPGTPVPSGAVKLLDLAAFFGAEAAQSASGADTVYHFAGVDAYQAENLFGMLRMQGYEVTAQQRDSKLPFTLTTDGVSLKFTMNDIGGLDMTAPAGTVFRYEAPPVTSLYLDTNGITAAQFASLTVTRRNSSVNYAGNSPSNYANGARAAAQNNTIYICDAFGQTGIYALDAATGETKLLSAQPKTASDLGVAGGYVYYCVYGAKSRVYRLKIDGSAAPELLLENAESLRVYGDRIFYVDKASGAFMRANLTGGNAETVLEKAGSYINIANNRLYCADPNGKRGIYSFALNGADELQLSNVRCNGIAVYGSLLYFISGSGDGHKVYMISVAGGEAKLLSRISATGVAATHESVFFTAAEDETLYRLDRASGKAKAFAYEARALSSFATAPACLLYYTGEYDKPRLYNLETGKSAKPDFS